MVVLEHNHAGQIMTMRIDSTNDHTIFLNQSKTLEKEGVNGGRAKGAVGLPGVVFRVPAMDPSYPYALARSFICFDLPTHGGKILM